MFGVFCVVFEFGLVFLVFGRGGIGVKGVDVKFGGWLDGLLVFVRLDKEFKGGERWVGLFLLVLMLRMWRFV